MARREARSTLLCMFTVVLAVACGPSGQARDPGGTNDGRQGLPGIDTSDLTSQEQQLWMDRASKLMAPCPGLGATVARCLEEELRCSACKHAARLLAAQVRLGKSAAQIDQAYHARFSPEVVHEIDAGNSPSLGPSNAPVVLVEWADFECSYCGKATASIHAVLREFPNQVRFVYKHFPLRSHAHSELAARASMAADQQGKFWELHEKLFASQALGLDEARIDKLAQEIGLDMGKFREALAGPAARAAVETDRRQAFDLKLKGTPMIFVNGRLFDLNYFDLTQDFVEWVKAEIEIAQADDSAASAERGTP